MRSDQEKEVEVVKEEPEAVDEEEHIDIQQSECRVLQVPQVGTFSIRVSYLAERSELCCA